MSQQPFKFKQFTINQDKCAMKIGTDGVLLGAWTKSTITEEPFNVLDIGTGTGVISLMIAQQFASTQIEALEIDENAFEQAVENFENSPWNDRLFCYHASFQEFFAEVDDEKYDLIVSNPPFFNASQKSDDKQRNIARFEDALPFEHLLFGTSKLLSENGTAAFIIPNDQEGKFLQIAEKMHLFPQSITHVQGNANSPIKRSLIKLSFKKLSHVSSATLILEKERHIYTEDYKKLVKEFYLNL